MAGSKERERAELHRTIWGVANDFTSNATCIMVLKKLNAEIAEIVKCETKLRKASDKIIEEIGE